MGKSQNLMTGDLRTPSPPSTTKDNADLAGLSLPPKPSNLMDSSTEANSTTSPCNKLLTATPLPTDVTEVGPMLPTTTSKRPEDKTLSPLTLTPPKTDNANSTLPTSSMLSTLGLTSPNLLMKKRCSTGLTKLRHPNRSLHPSHRFLHPKRNQGLERPKLLGN